MGIAPVMPSQTRAMARADRARERTGLDPQPRLDHEWDTSHNARGRGFQSRSRELEERIRYGNSRFHGLGTPSLGDDVSPRLSRRQDPWEAGATPEQQLRTSLKLIKADRFLEAKEHSRRAGFVGAALNWSDDPGLADVQAEGAVYYGQSLIYIVEIEQGCAVLRRVIDALTRRNEYEGRSPESGLDPKNWRRNLALGRACNILGYVCYRERGQYRLALRYFETALPYFEASNLIEEWANTIQNIGIVCSLLEMQDKAVVCLEKALEARQELGRPYRTALSRHARAMAYIESGEPHRARIFGEQAYDTCTELGAKRGIGVTATVLGRALHELATLSAVYDDRERLAYEYQAAKLLEEARDIFEGQVVEPTRHVEALLALGQCYSNLALFPGFGDGITRERQRRALACLGQAAEWAYDRHPVLYVSACIETARHHLRTRSLDEVEAWLQRAEDAVPRTYHLRTGLTSDDDPLEGCVDEFWRQVGELEMVRGHHAFDRVTRGGACDSFREAASQAMLCYAYALAQWRQFRRSTPESKGRISEILTRLKLGTRDDLGYVQEAILPQLEQRVGSVYCLPELVELALSSAPR